MKGLKFMELSKKQKTNKRERAIETQRWRGLEEWLQSCIITFIVEESSTSGL